MVLLKKLKIGQKMLLGFGMITIFMLIVLAYTYINFNKQSQNIELNIHTNNVITEADGIIISLVNMETGARGFALTGKETFLEPYNQGKIDYNIHFNNIKGLTLDDFNQQDKLTNLNNSYEDWLQWETSQVIDGRRNVISGKIKMEDLLTAVQSEKGKVKMDISRKILVDIVKQQQNLLTTRHDNLVKMEKQTAIILILGGLLAILLTIIVVIMVIRMVVVPIKTVTNSFKKISDGDADLEARLNIKANDELGDMAKYFNKFMVKLKELVTDNINQNWLKIGEIGINEKVRGDQDILALSTSIITYISKYLNAQIGLVYIKATEETFKLFGSYAYTRRKNLSNEIRVGEGIIGQAALEKKTILITNVPEDYIKVVSGVGEGVPKSILVTPCVYQNEVLGIIELASFNEFTDIQLQFIEKVSSNIAITIHSADARIKMKDLLAKTMQQSEELQSQQEELRQNNEELEEQTRALKESEANLQSEQEELKVTNEELEEHTKNLEMQKNHISIKNETLRKAQTEIKDKAKALEIASNYKSEFLANMSHELRTPLNSILVLSQMLADKKDNMPLSVKQLEFAKTIHSSGEDLLKLINEILDLSKVEAGKMEVNLEEIKLLELAGYVDKLFRPVTSQRGLDFKIEIEDGLPSSIVSDIQRVKQILNNLLSNAIKFTSSGKITMTFHSNYDKNFMGISITDTGIGIPIDKQTIIFEAFKQSDGTTSRKYGGTGLGLSISKQFAALLGGSINLVSEAQKGSTFTLLIPYNINKHKQLIEDVIISTKVEENILISNPISEPKIIDDRSLINKDEKSLLIIEDDKIFANVLLELARDKGYRCLTTQSGLEGINLAIKYNPDAILLDIGLPDISGWKVVSKLKENKNTKNISVHVISGSDNNDSSGKLNGVLGYLKKPASLENLQVLFMEIEEDILRPLKKLLIVDGDKDEFKSVVEVLSKKGFKITLLDSGLEAYDALKTESFDCLILNLKLKDMSGFELLEKLKNEDIVSMKIIIHTEDDLTRDDELELQKYTQSIIIKGTRSTERLVSEVSLFLHDLESKIEEKQVKVMKSEHEKKDVLNNKKILVVDDDMRNVFALTSVLEEKGIEVVVGRNGKEGISKLNENPDIDLILMDIMMPEMDGYVAIREIRRQGKFKKIPIIAITAKAMKDDKQKCIDAGADEYLTKPIDMDKLISLLRVWLYK